MRSAGIEPELATATIASQTKTLNGFVIKKSNELTANLNYHPKMSPLDFEQFCAEILSRNGWNTNLTASTGDQGVDIIAKRGAHTIAIQCKLYTGPVGNKAVQEAYTARAHIGATKAVVVTNSEFTPQARQLAATTGTVLLHFTELATL